MVYYFEKYKIVEKSKEKYEKPDGFRHSTFFLEGLKSSLNDKNLVEAR